MRVTIYSDGSSRGNPGPGGYGTILTCTDASGATHRRELSQGFARTTNNRMEILGVVAGLEALRRPCEVEVRSDSQYVVNAVNKRWLDAWQRNGWRTAAKKPVKNPDLWQRLLRAMAPHDVTFSWVRGHAGNEMNERCDELATSAADGAAGPLAEDAGFEG